MFPLNANITVLLLLQIPIKGSSWLFVVAGSYNSTLHISPINDAGNNNGAKVPKAYPAFSIRVQIEVRTKHERDR